MMINVRDYHGGICPGATLARLNSDCTVTCETVPEDGMIEVDACCNPLIEREKTPCPDLEEQVDCGPCSNGCGCSGSSSAGGDTMTEETVVGLIESNTPAIVEQCLESEQTSLEAGKPSE